MKWVPGGKLEIPMDLHRFRTTAIIGKWRRTRKEACQDAIKAGLARLDERAPEGVSWKVPVEIESKPDSSH